MDAKAYYNLGKRDAVAEILMMLRRERSPLKVFDTLAKQLLAAIPDHPHAEWTVQFVADQIQLALDLQERDDALLEAMNTRLSLGCQERRRMQRIIWWGTQDDPWYLEQVKKREKEQCPSPSASSSSVKDKPSNPAVSTTKP